MTDDQQSLTIGAGEWFRHADNLLVGRVNYAMVAQSMLILSFSTLLSSPESRKWLPAELGIAVFGVLFAVVQSALSLGLVAKMGEMEKRLKQTDRVFEAYIEARSKFRPPYIQRFGVPIGLCCLWVWLGYLAIR
jgi:hypothetical protein